MSTACSKAIALWQEKNEGADPAEATEVALLALIPPIQKLDSALNSLVNVKKLSLSTNAIDKMISLPGLKNLEILSLGRNQIKKIAGLEEVGNTLKELWISYNHISTLDGLHPCVKLTTLFIGNNKIKNWEELLKLGANSVLDNVLLLGNPLYDGLSRKAAAPKVISMLPSLRTVDGEMITGFDSDNNIATVIKENLISNYGSLDDALAAASGVSTSQSLEKNDFITALSNLKIDSNDAETLFDAMNGEPASLEDMVNYILQEEG